MTNEPFLWTSLGASLSHPQLSLFQSAPFTHGDWVDGPKAMCHGTCRPLGGRIKQGFAGCLTGGSPGFSSDLLRLRPCSKSAKNSLSAKNLSRLPSASFLPILGRLALSPAPFPEACTDVGMWGADRES